MKKRLTDFLVCIYCDLPLTLRATSLEGEEVITGELLCPKNHTFPITRGVPRMTPMALDRGKRETAKNFGYQWMQFNHLTDHYRQQFLDWVAPIREKDFAGSMVLDAGCGKGRHVYWGAQFGAREIIGMDLSESVDAAFENTRHLENAHIVQADIFHLPFKKELFDIVFSLGVIHHLPDPKEGFDHLTRVVRPGGRIMVWVYGREHNGWIVRIVDPLRKHITSRLPHRLLRIAAFLITLPLYVLTKWVYRPLAHRAPAIAEHLFYHAYLSYIGGFPFKEIYLIVFDHLVAPTAFYLRKEEIEQWFTDARLSQAEYFWHNENSWRAVGVKS